MTETGDGATTLAALDTVEGPAVVVLDVKLPDMPGLAVLREIRKRRPDVSVVMMTAYWASEALAEARRLGVRDLFAKPVDLDRVAAAVSAARSATVRAALPHVSVEKSVVGSTIAYIGDPLQNRTSSIRWTK